MKNLSYAILAVVLLALNVESASELNMCENTADGIFLPNPNDCTHYYTCMGEKAYPGQCSEGNYFSANTQRCDIESKTQCAKQCTEALEFNSLSKTCKIYYICFGGQAIYQSCPDNLEYNAQTERCDFPYNVDCVDNMCTGINDPENIVFLPSHRDCKDYYICYNGSPVHQSCTNGLHFNPAKNNCDYKENVNCTITAKSRNLLPYSKMPPTRANIPCPKNGFHFYPSPSDPASYYFCSNGKGLVLTCSPGLVYDKKSESCRDPKNVKK